jgi:hypothetical protein
MILSHSFLTYYCDGDSSPCSSTYALERYLIPQHGISLTAKVVSLVLEVVGLAGLFSSVDYFE